jgi:hypothetical protein
MTIQVASLHTRVSALNSGIACFERCSLFTLLWSAFRRSVLGWEELQGSSPDCRQEKPRCTSNQRTRRLPGKRSGGLPAALRKSAWLITKPLLVADISSAASDCSGIFWCLPRHVAGFPAVSDHAHLSLGMGLERIGCAGVLLVTSIIAGVILRFQIIKPLFQSTFAEFQKDREWLAHSPTKTR